MNSNTTSTSQKKISQQDLKFPQQWMYLKENSQTRKKRKHWTWSWQYEPIRLKNKTHKSFSLTSNWLISKTWIYHYIKPTQTLVFNAFLAWKWLACLPLLLLLLFNLSIIYLQIFCIIEREKSGYILDKTGTFCKPIGAWGVCCCNKNCTNSGTDNDRQDYIERKTKKHDVSFMFVIFRVEALAY